MNSNNSTVDCDFHSKTCKIERKINGNLKIDDVEKKILQFLGEKMCDRNLSIRDLETTLFDIEKKYAPKKPSFYFLNKSEGLKNVLETSEVNCKNIDYKSCYISAYLQGLIHIVFPKAMKKYNETKKQKIENFDELKSEDENEFYNVFIDSIIKQVEEIQGFGNGGKDKDGNIIINTEEICKILNIDSLEDDFSYQGLLCEIEINEAIYRFCQESKKVDQKEYNNLNEFLKMAFPNPPKKKNSIVNQELIRIFEISKSTIISEVMKIKIDNKFFLNIVLNFDL